MGFTLASLWGLRRWILPRLRLDTDASLFFGAAVMQSAMVLYGLVAALTAVSEWTRHAKVSDTVSREATAIAIDEEMRRLIRSRPGAMTATILTMAHGHTMAFRT